MGQSAAEQQREQKPLEDGGSRRLGGVAGKTRAGDSQVALHQKREQTRARETRFGAEKCGAATRESTETLTAAR